MSFLSDIGDIYTKLKSDVGGLKSKISPAKVQSIAKKARKSIIHYPVIITDSLSAEVDLLGPLVHYVQARAAVYTRIVITNEDPSKLMKDGKGHLMKSLAGRDVGTEDIDFLSNIGDANVEVFLLEKVKQGDLDFFSPVPSSISSLLEAPIDRQGKGKEEGGSRIPEIQDQKIDKMSGVLPTVLQIRVNAKVDDETRPVDFVLVIKAVAHQVPSMDLRNALQAAVIENSFIIKVLRLTSGEISFIKDFLLNMKQVRKQFTRSSKAATKTMATLYRQSQEANPGVVSVFKEGLVPPTATIVVSSEEVDELRYRTNIDLSKPKTIKDLLKKHHFMSFMIVDNTIGVVSVFDEGDGKFDRVTIMDIKKLATNARRGGGQTNIEDLVRLMRG